jgi:hypothetical protein
MDYLSTSELVDMAKDILHIRTPNPDMTDDEVRKVIRWIGMDGACSHCKGEKPFCQSVDLLLMLIVTAVEFPKFFTKFELAEPN